MGPEKVRFSGSDSELETRVVPGSDPEMDSDSDDADDAVGVGYVSLSQEPYGEGETEATDINETLREMRLYLPPPPPPEIDINAETENEIHLQSIHMDEEHVELVKRTMASVRLPQRATPTWAHEFTDDQWQAMINKIIQGRSSPN